MAGRLGNQDTMSGPQWSTTPRVAIGALTLNQWVHGSSPRAPTIEINGLQETLNIKSEPEAPSGQRSGQHFRNFAAPVALPIARKPVGKAKSVS
jgi:hypothetical protein